MGMNLQYGGPDIKTAEVSGDSFSLGGYHYLSGTNVRLATVTAGAPPTLTFASGVIVVSSGSIASGAVQSGHVGSGSIQGFFGSTRNVASGTLGVSDFGSGAIIAGTVGSGAVQSGNVASGSLGRFHIGSGQLAGFELGSGAIISGRIASGQIGFGHLANESVQSGTLASGSISRFAIASGSLLGFELGSGAIISGRIASGAIGFGHLADASVQSGTVASGQISRFALASGAVTSGHVAAGVFDSIAPTTTAGDIIVFSGAGNSRLPVGSVVGSLLTPVGGGVIAWAPPPFNVLVSAFTFVSGSSQIRFRFVAAELISGLKAVAFASGDGYTVVTAERGSGLRLPAIGVTMSGGVSGATIDVVVRGHLTSAASGMIASGFHTQPLYVGSGGLIVNRSGFMEGASSGDPFLSGNAVQKIGQAISGGIWVDPGEPRSGYVTAAAMGIF